MKRLKHLCLAIALLLSTQYGIAQPSSSAVFAFRFYHDGHMVDQDTFCRDWSLTNGNGDSISPCDINSSSQYDPTRKYFFISVGAIYPPHIFSLIHKKDTMTVVLPSTTHYICDSLTLHRGNFLFDNSCSDAESVKLDNYIGVGFCPLKNIDWNLQRRKFEESGLKERR